MKLAISNIAWDPERSSEILPSLQGHGVEGLVIAPTMVWPEAPNVDARAAREYREMVNEHGLRIVGFQSLIFGRSDVALFGDTAERQRLADHLKRQTELARQLGARSLIFGSPGLRKDTELSLDRREEMATELFRDVAAAAADNGTRLNIEPLAGYGNQFIMTTKQGVELVERVDHPGFGLHLDAAAIAGSPEDPTESLPDALARTGIASFDISAPELGLPSLDSTTPHKLFAQVLRDNLYSGPVSIEMRGPQTPDSVVREIKYAQSQYFL